MTGRKAGGPPDKERTQLFTSDEFLEFIDLMDVLDVGFHAHAHNIVITNMP